MLAIADWQRSQDNPQVSMIMQVHDELVFEIHQEAVESSKIIICNLMERTVKLSVPLVVSIGVGANWDAAH